MITMRRLATLSGADCAFGGSAMKKAAGTDFYAVMTDADRTPLFRFDRQGHRTEALAV